MQNQTGQQGAAIELIEAPANGRSEVARREAPPLLTVAPQTTAGDLHKRMALIREVMASEMREEVDYGRVPGSTKPSLLKPGAEKLAATFQLDVQCALQQEFGPGEHLTVRADATLYDARSGARLGSGSGMCTTRERKYAKRSSARACPHCGAEAIIKGKQEYGGGWLCFARKGGCGAKFADGDASIESQSIGEIDNPDLPDCWNTVVKMARKRAVVDAVLLVTSASAIFTQDVEDQLAETPAPKLPTANAADVEAARAATATLLGVDEAQDASVQAIFAWLAAQHGGTIPLALTRTLIAVARKREAVLAEAEGADDGVAF